MQATYQSTNPSSRARTNLWMLQHSPIKNIVKLIACSNKLKIKFQYLTVLNIPAE